MPLAVSEIRDLRTFTQGFTNDVLAVYVVNDVSAGYNLAMPPVGARVGSSAYSPIAYDQIRDRLIYEVRGNKELPGGAQGVAPGLISHDALCRNSRIGWYIVTTDVPGGFAAIFPGQPNLQTGQQKMYTYSGGASAIAELSSVDGSFDAVDVFPNVTNFFASSAASSGNAGYYIDLANGEPFNAIVFDGITDSTLMPEIEIGGPTHTKGLVLMHATQVNLDGGTNLTARWIWIDPDTNNAVGILDVPIEADSLSTNPSAEPSIDGQDFEWYRCQFVADEGSTFAQPKGELHFFMHALTTADFDFAGQTVTAPDQTFTSTVERNYVSVIEFNPFGVTAGTVRTHLRNIFQGSFEIPYEPIISGGNSCSPATTGNNNFDTRAGNTYYHPPSRTYINIQGTSEFANSEGADDPRVGDSRIIRFRRSVTVGSIGKPVPETAVTELRTVRARIQVLSDLGNVAVSTPVAISMFKKSTRDEQFNGTTVGAGTYTVDQAEIDEDGHLEVREQGGVDDVSGILLVETTDYTVAYGTGILTPVGSWPTETIHVRYRHRDVRVGTGHGTLLSATSTTDANGVAYARIQYADNLDGELDEIEVTA